MRVTANANTSITDADRPAGDTSGVTRILLPLALLFALGPLAGCGGDGDEGAAPGGGATTGAAATTAEEPGTTAEDPATVRVLVYYVRDEKLGAGARRVEGPAVARAAMEALLEGPAAPERAVGMTTAIPEGTQLLGLSVDGGTATVDLTSAFAAGGGSLSMRARVAQVVATLTQFPTVERVAFRIDGEPAVAIGGEGVVVDPPRTRADIEDLTPAILLETPAVGETVSDPIRIRGTANAFEATFMVRVVDDAGSELYKHFVMATSGSGDRGTFDAEIDLPDDAAAGPIVLSVYEDNMGEGENGGAATLHQVDVPLRLEG